MSQSTITTEVTADPTNGTLDVKDHGGPIHVHKEEDTTQLIWNLKLEGGQSGSFNTIDDSGNSGFSWVSPAPPSGIFGTPTLEDGNQQIWMTDSNTGSGTDGGPYTYTLRATVDNVPCATTASTSPRGTVNNPQIKNQPD